MALGFVGQRLRGGGVKILGFIGTGGMGKGMAANLIKAGYRLIVNDLPREQARELEGEGAQFKDAAKAVGEACDLVLSMLPNNDAVRTVGLDKGGLAEATSGAKVWIDFSSIEAVVFPPIEFEATEGQVNQEGQAMLPKFTYSQQTRLRIPRSAAVFGSWERACWCKIRTELEVSRVQRQANTRNASQPRRGR